MGSINIVLAILESLKLLQNKEGRRGEKNRYRHTEGRETQRQTERKKIEQS